jgi:DNA-binding PadR family transcriptional regulator
MPFRLRCAWRRLRVYATDLAIYASSIYNGDMTLGRPVYYTLAALMDGPLHGYGIIKRAHDLSDGRMRLAAGTLYAALDRLRDAGLVELDREEIVDGRTRRSYRLTGAGREALRAEAARLEISARIVLRQMTVRS